MKEFLRLPYDSSGYGDFGVSYIGIDSRVHFRYMHDARKLVGELYFEFCIAISVNGVLNNQETLPYDIVMSDNYVNERYDGFSRYAFMLSGSDFQFNVIAKNCTFANSVEDSPLIADN